MTDYKTKIFLDGLTSDEIINNIDDRISGYTFNPSLYKELGVKNYLVHSKNLVKLVGNKPISLEVTGDDKDTIIRQSIILSELGKNVYVKIPITFTDGNYTLEILRELVSNDVKINITAVFTIEQINEIIPIISNTKNIISVFAGRLFDIGVDARVEMKNISSFVHENSDCKVLWASPRMSYDFISANEAKCDIITMSMPIFNKLKLINKTPSDYSLETVKMFFKDANDSGYFF